jgi:DNA-binding beta-propeller fold protein YncE
MVILRTRRALFVAALFAVAGCGGGSSSPSLSSATGSPFVHRGMPFAPASHHAVMQSVHPTYSTKKSLVFEGDQDLAAVNVYQTKKLGSNPAPYASIKVSVGCPYGLVADKSGTIYVADNCGGSDVELYAKGSTTLKSKITTGISNPLGLAMDSSQTLYVSNYPASITEYKYATTTPYQTITGGGLTDPFGLAVDSSQNLYIADFGAAKVFEVKAGTTTVTDLGLSDLTEPIGVAIDKSNGDLWVTDGSGDKVNVYAAGSTTPSHTITGFAFPYAISLQNTGKPKGTVVVSDITNKAAYAYKHGQYTPYATLTNGVELPTGLLITKP